MNTSLKHQKTWIITNEFTNQHQININELLPFSVYLYIYIYCKDKNKFQNHKMVRQQYSLLTYILISSTTVFQLFFRYIFLPIFEHRHINDDLLKFHTKFKMLVNKYTLQLFLLTRTITIIHVMGVGYYRDNSTNFNNFLNIPYSKMNRIHWYTLNMSKIFLTLIFFRIRGVLTQSDTLNIL